MEYLETVTTLDQFHSYYTKNGIRKRTRYNRKQLFDGRCAYCLEYHNNLTLDHFIPKSRGGRHCEHNLIPACLHCNKNKDCKMPHDWYFDQSFFCLDQWLRILANVGEVELNQVLKY